MSPREKANRLRWQDGMKVRAIASRLGVSPGTIYRWTDETAARRDREQSRAYKARNRTRTRAYDRTRVDACPSCGGKKYTGSAQCAACDLFTRRQRMRFIQALWKEGRTTREMAILFDTTEGSIRATVGKMRADGWDMPHRPGYPRPRQEAAA